MGTAPLKNFDLYKKLLERLLNNYEPIIKELTKLRKDLLEIYGMNLGKTDENTKRQEVKEAISAIKSLKEDELLKTFFKKGWHSMGTTLEEVSGIFPLHSREHSQIANEIHRATEHWKKFLQSIETLEKDKYLEESLKDFELSEHRSKYTEKFSLFEKNETELYHLTDILAKFVTLFSEAARDTIRRENYYVVGMKTSLENNNINLSSASIILDADFIKQIAEAFSKSKKEFFDFELNLSLLKVPSKVYEEISRKSESRGTKLVISKMNNFLSQLKTGPVRPNAKIESNLLAHWLQTPKGKAKTYELGSAQAAQDYWKTTGEFECLIIGIQSNTADVVLCSNDRDLIDVARAWNSNSNRILRVLTCYDGKNFRFAA